MNCLNPRMSVQTFAVRSVVSTRSAYRRRRRQLYSAYSGRLQLVLFAPVPVAAVRRSRQTLRSAYGVRKTIVGFDQEEV